MEKLLIKYLFFTFLVFTGWEAFGQCTNPLSIFNSPAGPTIWTVPSGVTSITIETWGAGGKGGGANSNGTYGGGGGGGYSRSTIVVTPGQTFYYSVGAGSISNLNPGGNSWFSTTNIEGGSIVRALGGSSVTATGTTGANGGGLGTGTIMFSGGRGANAGADGGGGGSSAGTGANGVDATSTTGAIAPIGGGNGGNGSNGGIGGNGFSPGGGGGGSERSGSNFSGGNGGNGQINITNASPANTVSSATPDQTVCINSALTPINHTTTGATGIGTPINLPAGVTASWASNTITISGTPTVSGSFSYSIPMTGGCTTGALPATGTITVTPNQTASAASSSPTLCINTALITSITHTTTRATGIANEGVAGANGLPAGVSASWAGNTITISGTPTSSGTFNYTIPLTGGCGTVNATGTIIVSAPAAIITPSLAGQTRCFNAAFSPISVGAGPGFTYQWFSNDTPDNITPTLITGATSPSYTPLSNFAGTLYYYVEVTSASCGSSATSEISGAFLVNPLPAVTFTAQPAGPNVCVDTDVTYSTQSGELNYVWTIPGTAGTDYTITSGGNGSNSLVIQWLTPGNKSVSVNYQDANGCGSTAAATSTTIIIQKNTASVASNPTPIFCANETITAFTHTTTLATGIGTTSGLPAGLSASFASNTITISGTVAGTVAPGNYAYTIPLIGGCGTVAASGTITISSINTVTPAPTISPVCINTALTSFTHTTASATGIANNGIAGANGLPAGVSASWAGNTITISGTPTASGTFNYSIPLTGGCGTVNATGTIIVTPNNTATAAPVISPVCINTPLTSFTHTTNGATGIGTATGFPAGVTAVWVGNTITISGTPTASGTFNYSIPLTGGCGAINATGTITVTPNMVVTSTTPNRTVCIDSPLTAINHTTTRATGIGTATGLPAGVTASWASNTITISGTPTASGTFNYSIPLTGGCGTVNATGTITVTPNNTVTPAPVISPVCINTALTSFTHTTTGSNGIANNGVAGANGLPAGVSATRAGNTITISGTPTVSGTFNYSIPLNGGCGTVSATGTIIVSPNNTASVPSSTPTLCINTGLSSITHTTTGATGIGVATGLPMGVSASWASNTITISGTPSQSGTFNYSIPMTGGCGAVNATGTITVTPDNTASAPSSTPTVCISTALTNITISTTGATGIGVATGLPSGVSANWASNTITISGTPTASGTFTYTIPLTGGCGAVNATGTITVTPDNTVSAPSSTPTLCINTPLTNITHSSIGASGISNSGVSGANGLPAGLSATWTGNVITITGTPTAAGTFNYSIPLTGGCANLFAEGTITVNPATAITDEQLAAQSICDQDLFSPISITATGVGTLSYQWFSNTNPTATGGTPVGTNSPSYTPSAAAIGTLYYYAVVSSGCGPNAISKVSGAFIVDPFTVITTQPDDTGDVECFGDGFDPISVVATGANLSYQWFSNTTNSNSGGTAIPTATLATFTPLSTTQGTAYYYVIVTGNCGVLTSDISGEYLVTPPVTTINIDPSTSDEVSCFGGSFPELEVGAIGETDASFPNILYQWYSNATNSNTGGTLISGANLAKFTPPTSSLGTLYYYATAASKCGTVPTDVSGAFTVTPLSEITAQSLDTQVICDGETFDPISIVAVGTGTINYQWFRNTAANTTSGTPITGANASSFTPPSNAVGTIFYYVEVTSDCGADTSTISGAMIVNPEPIPTFDVSPGALVCEQDGITYTTQSGKSDYTWAIAGNAGVDYTITAGGIGSTNESVTIKWLTAGSKTVTVSYAETSTGCIASSSASSTTTVEPFATVGPPSVAFPSVCISNPVLAPFTQPTTGVTAIGTPTGLPPGITAIFNSTTKNIEFSGTITGTATGLYNYSIPLSGNCINGLQAKGTIDVTPVYEITAVSSVSATTIGGAATVTFFADPTKMPNGTYLIDYQIAQGSGGFTQIGPVNATVVNGKGTFTTTPINSVTDTYTVQILGIKKSSDVCTVSLPTPPTTYFGVCSAVFGGNSTFTVPANVYSITIEVYGGGGGGNAGGGGGGGGYSIRQNIPVTPGEPIAVFVGKGGGNSGAEGGASYVTRDSNIANQLANSLVLANGGKGATTGNAAGGTFDSRYSGSNGDNANGSNGGKAGGPLGGAAGGDGVNGSAPGGGGGRRSGTRGIGGDGLVIISYSCPDADNTDCIKVIDDGSKSGITILEFTCDYDWVAPEGLAEFTVYVGSGGGGGGSGEGSGGGGSGSLIRQTFTSSSPFGMPAGSNFPITVGQGGLGAQTINANGFSGQTSTFSGIINGTGFTISVPGGGGGGSQSTNAGGNGSSGGGGGASPNPSQTFGVGGSTIPITYTGTNVTVYQGNTGGSGDYSAPQNSVAGGGGGGLIPWGSGNDGQNGKAAGNGQGEGGRGGDGQVITFGDSLRYFGGGGGGIGRYFNGTDKIGLGGIAGGVMIGGSGNLSGVNPIGGAGTNKTGSGGGAGYFGGGRGGNGVVYVVYFNFRILGVEYEYFKADFNSQNRSGVLHWATTQEWENSHFEIERSINDANSWEKIGQVKSEGNSDNTVSYAFEDLKLPLSGGNIFYRLKQVSLDEASSYSVVKSIQVEAMGGIDFWRVYPNPTSGDPIHVERLGKADLTDKNITLRIISANGQFDSIEGSSSQQLSSLLSDRLRGKAAGIYTLEISWDTHREYHKIILKR